MNRLIFRAALAAASLTATLAHAEPTYALHLGGVSHHFQSPQEVAQSYGPDARWNERHPGVGIERRVATGDGWTAKQAIGTLQDSFYTRGGYLTLAWQKELAAPNSAWSFQVGGAAHLFYRALKQFHADPELVPLVSPVVSVAYKPLGLGVNVVAFPRLPVDGFRSPAVVLAQFVVELP